MQYDLNFYLDRFITNDKSRAQDADGWRNILIDDSVPGKDGAVEIVEQDTYAFPMIDSALKARAVCHAHTSCCARAMLAARARARAPTPDRAVRSTICTSAWSCSRCIRAPDPTSARAHTLPAMTAVTHSLIAACRRARSEHASPTARHRYRTALKTGDLLTTAPWGQTSGGNEWKGTLEAAAATAQEFYDGKHSIDKMSEPGPAHLDQARNWEKAIVTSYMAAVKAYAEEVEESNQDLDEVHLKLAEVFLYTIEGYATPPTQQTLVAKGKLERYDLGHEAVDGPAPMVRYSPVGFSPQELMLIFYENTCVAHHDRIAIASRWHHGAVSMPACAISS